jgi:hypothetical protein
MSLWKQGQREPNKPKKWKTDRGHLTPQAKKYMSYRLQLVKSEPKNLRAEDRKTLKEAKQQKPQREDRKIRMWAKFSTHRGAEPLYLECFIEGFASNYNTLKHLLIDAIDRNFNSQGGHNKLIDSIAEEIEVGTTIIENFTKYEGFIHIAYKHHSNSHWRTLK